MILFLCSFYSSYFLLSSYYKSDATSKLVEDSHSAWKTVQAERQSRVKLVCEKYGNKIGGQTILHEYVHSRKTSLFIFAIKMLEMKIIFIFYFFRINKIIEN